MRKTLDALNAWAGLLGACGVAAAAAAAHLPGGENLRSVALILLVHAAALPGLTARAREGSAGARLWLAAALAIALGAALFSADVARLTLRGARLFPFAAPLGGTAMILGWLIASAAGLADLFRGYP
jgi:uncharacterized membrane protein YgdD (TMEM256/DUF423 family)